MVGELDWQVTRGMSCVVAPWLTTSMAQPALTRSESEIGNDAAKLGDDFQLLAVGFCRN